MLRHQGEERRSVLVVHNQCVERPWRDMHRCVTSLYYRLFYYLENTVVLNPIDNAHIFCLHYDIVFIPHINRALQEFVGSWNHHGVRTEHGQSPNQLFTVGSLQLWNSGIAALDVFDTVTETYGVDNDLEFESTVNPLGESGEDLFIQTLHLVQSFTGN